MEGKTQTNRDKYIERLKSRYPEKEFADDEEIFGQANDDYDDYDSRVSKYKDSAGKLMGMIKADPKSASYLNNWAKGADPVVELVKQYGLQIKDIIDDPERQEEMAAANKEYVDRVADNQKLEDEYKANLSDTIALLDQLKEEKGWDDEYIDKVMALLVGIARDGIVGKFSREAIEMADKAINHDADVATASDEAEIRGRNAKIEEKLRKPSMGDGVTKLDGKATDTTPQKQRRNSMFALAEKAM